MPPSRTGWRLALGRKGNDESPFFLHYFRILFVSWRQNDATDANRVCVFVSTGVVLTPKVRVERLNYWQWSLRSTVDEPYKPVVSFLIDDANETLCHGGVVWHKGIVHY